MEPAETLSSPTSSDGYVGRFAPSPTGPLHFGSLVAAVASYADARQARGQWLLRIEDVDTTRCSAQAETAILRTLSAYGFEHDGEVVRQSERSAYYDHALQRLASANRIFACTCTRKQLEMAPRNREGEAIYPGTCRNTPRSGAPHALRICIPGARDPEVSFTDRACGAITQNLKTEIGDFVLRRADGLFAYQLAVVVDDSLQGVTHIVRGQDLLLNTPRQIFLQRLLGYHTPTYLHVPLVRDDHGEKLSKQTRAQAISIDNPLPTLHEAWAFLRQAPVGAVQSPAAFWQRAAELWSITPLVAAAGSFRFTSSDPS